MNKYISIKVILDRLLRHPLMLDLTFEAAVDYAVDFMRIVGMPKMFMEKSTKIEIKNYKGLLPEDIYKIVSVSCDGRYLTYTGDSSIIRNEEVAAESNSINNIPSIDNNKKVQQHLTAALITRGDFIYTQNLRAHVYVPADKKDVYKVLNDIIYTSIKEGTLDIIYSAIETDEDGLPMILDNSSYLRALELYIKKLWFTILFEMGLIQGPILLNIQQEYAWAVGDCHTEFNRMTLNQAEYFYKSMKSTLLDDKHHQYGFKLLGR